MGLILLVFCLTFISSLVSAQCSGSTTITTNSDADAISSCSTFNGDIVIASAATGDIYLNGIDSITGNLTVIDATAVTSLNAEKLTSIGGTLWLSNLPKLKTVAFASLQQVHALRCIGLPDLQGLSFDTILIEVEDIYISDTGLTAFDGIALGTVGSIDFNNNSNLQTVGFDALLNSTSSLSFQANAPELTVQLTSLQVAYGNLTFQNISGWNISDLQNVTGSFTCYSCAIPNYRALWVQIVSGDLAFVSSDFQTLDFPVLTTVGGGFQVSNNSHLAELSVFPWLAAVDGPITLHGAFNSIDFPSLEFVQGYIDVETTSSNTTICDDFNTLYSTHDLKGGLNCQVSVTQNAAGSVANTDSGTNTTSSSNTVTSTAGSSSGLKAGAIVGIVVGVFAVGFGIALAVLLRRRSSKEKAHPMSELDTDGLVQTKEGRAELYVDPRNVAEMEGHGNYAVELDSRKTNKDGTSVREIPGIHEATGSINPKLDKGRQIGTLQELMSPVSPMEHMNDSGKGTSVATTEKASGSRTTTKSG